MNVGCRDGTLLAYPAPERLKGSGSGHRAVHAAPHAYGGGEDPASNPGMRPGITRIFESAIPTREATHIEQPWKGNGNDVRRTGGSLAIPETQSALFCGLARRGPGPVRRAAVLPGTGPVQIRWRRRRVGAARMGGPRRRRAVIAVLGGFADAGGRVRTGRMLRACRRCGRFCAKRTPGCRGCGSAAAR